MTPLLAQAIERVQALPESEQEVIAALILREINADNRLPFHLPSVQEVHEGKGFVYLEDDFLIFRFTILNWGVTEGDWETVKVERGLIDGIRSEKGIFKDKLLIQTRNQRLLDAIPGDHRTELSLRTRKQDRVQVVSFIERVRAWMKVQQTV